MRILVLVLISLVVVLFVSQFFGKKGTWVHIIKGILMSILSLVIVVINTVEISLKSGLIWDTAFIIHTVVGGLFFISLVATSIAGYRVKKGKLDSLTHYSLATVVGIFLFLTLFTAVLIRFIR